ncbi:hypothetical protein HY993_01860 [Candidatus Micrarchaeota archaeon]|nr:hypothetical protein [Candidatus Micrarchaeota archaeon]
MVDAALIALGAVAVMANAYAYYEYKASKETLDNALGKAGRQKLDSIKAEATGTTFDDLFEKPRSTDYGSDAVYEKKSLESVHVFPNPFVLPPLDKKARTELEKRERDYIEFRKIRGVDEAVEGEEKPLAQTRPPAQAKPIEGVVKKADALTEISLTKLSAAPAVPSPQRQFEQAQRAGELKQEIRQIKQLFLANKIDEETYSLLLEEKERELAGFS